MRRRDGWVFLDVLMGVILISILAVVLSAAEGWHVRTLQHLADSRAASHLAESALTTMQSGQVPGADGAGQTSVAIHPLSSSAGAGNMSWVQVRATVRGQRASLVGLVPRNLLPEGGGR